MTVAPPHRVAAVRPATAHDRTTLDTLRHAALTEIETQRGGDRYQAVAFPDPGDPDHPLWVAEIDGEVVGYLLASSEGDLGRVDGVYVAPACRAVGAGEALMGAALDWFRNRNCNAVDAIALPGARATKNFFEESGFTARLLVMHHRL